MLTCLVEMILVCSGKLPSIYSFGRDGKVKGANPSLVYLNIAPKRGVTVGN